MTKDEVGTNAGYGRKARAAKRAKKSTNVGGKNGEGPAEIGGGGPTSGSHTAPLMGLDSGDPGQEHISRLPSIHIEKVYPVASDILSVPSILPTVEMDKFPEPDGMSRTNTKIPWVHGRESDGKIIFHERSEETAGMVLNWVAMGATDNDMAAYLGIRPGQLREHYAHELNNGKFVNDMAVGKTILSLAKAGVPQLSIFWAKARMGWRDTDKAEQNNAALLNIHIHTEE